jgi:hypothetical protein
MLANHLPGDIVVAAVPRSKLIRSQCRADLPWWRFKLTVRAKRARAAETSPAARALRSDVVRRAASRGGTLRCAEARRVAYRDVNKSYASHRLSQDGWSRGDFKTAPLT